MTDHDAQPLEPSLERAKTELRTALDEACSADIEGADTGELIRVEEVLAIANEAAKAAVSVRRRLSRDRSAGGRTSSPISSTSRELLDGDGVRWSVFEVHPSTEKSRPAVRERFRDGWLTFDCGTETRRIAPVPQAWREKSDLELIALLGAAERAARPRKQ